MYLMCVLVKVLELQLANLPDVLLDRQDEAAQRAGRGGREREKSAQLLCDDLLHGVDNY